MQQNELQENYNKAIAEFNEKMETKNYVKSIVVESLTQNMPNIIQQILSKLRF